MRRLDEILRRTAGTDAPPDLTATSSDTSDEDNEEEACPLCHGAGFLRHNVPLGHADFGRAFPCRCVQEEGEQERLARLQRYSNLGPLTRVTFQGLQAGSGDRFPQALAAARRFADDPSGWLVLGGPSGSGKTRLAAAVANHCLGRGQPTLFMVVPDLLDHLRVAYAPGADLPYDALFQQVRDAPLLVLDELGSQAPTPWAQEKLFQLINHRYIHQLPTVVTLAAPLEALEDRLRTRLSDAAIALVVNLEGGPAPSSAEGMALPLLRNMRFDTFNL
ncbi:MAG: ATP-binding protein, partial [Dehalococcoidia bacterium]